MSSDSSAGGPDTGESSVSRHGDTSPADGEVWHSIADAPEQREHLGELYWGLFATSVVLWLSVQVGLMFALPDSVPLHWSGRTIADGWTTRLGAFIGLWLPLVVPVALPFASRLVLKRPLSALVRSRRFWLGSPDNRRRFERLMREDLILVSVMWMVVLAWLSFAVGLASKDDNGAMAGLVFTLPPVLLAVGIVVVLLRGYMGRRYEPQAHEDLSPPEMIEPTSDA